MELLSIRKADPSDASILFGLIDALADYEKLPRPSAEARARLAEDAWGERPRFEPWIALANGDPAAYAITFETYSTFLALPTLYLEDLFVKPEYRAQRVGKRLFLEVVREAERRGCGRMEWVCLDWNELGLNFYKKFGASQMQEWVSHRLDQHAISRLVKGE